MGSHATRQRYWARSLLGWPVMAQARPGQAHAALAQLQQRGWIEGLVTQNVDGLHTAAGSDGVIAARGRMQAVHILGDQADRKSTRLNSSHQIISYSVFCLKKKKKEYT